MTSPAARLITLIMLLQREPNQKASQLAGKLGVSVRTLHRYFAMLDEMGIPIYSERGPQGGFSLVRGYRMPPLMFTPDEAVAVSLGTSLVEEMWGRLYREPAQGALAKLENVLPDEQRSQVAWARRSLVVAGMRRARLENVEGYLETLRRAVREQRQVSMEYRGSNDQDGVLRCVDPYALLFRGGWWYMVGHCHLRDAVRLFRIDRIQELALLRETFKLPGDFDVHAYLGSSFASHSQVRMRMRFKPEAKPIALRNLSIWETVEDQPDGSAIVTMISPDQMWAASTALGFGSLAVVLEPEEVRSLVFAWAQAIVADYR